MNSRSPVAIYFVWYTFKVIVMCIGVVCSLSTTNRWCQPPAGRILQIKVSLWELQSGAFYIINGTSKKRPANVGRLSAFWRF